MQVTASVNQFRSRSPYNHFTQNSLNFHNQNHIGVSNMNMRQGASGVSKAGNGNTKTKTPITLLTRSGKIESKAPVIDTNSSSGNNNVVVDFLNKISASSSPTNANANSLTTQIPKQKKNQMSKTRDRAKSCKTPQKGGKKKGGSDSETFMRSTDVESSLNSAQDFMMASSAPSAQRRSKSPPTAEKFAWSKFQSAPDAKMLPIPNFILRERSATNTGSKVSDHQSSSISSTGIANDKQDSGFVTPVKTHAQKFHENESKTQSGKESDKVKLLLSTFSQLRASSNSNADSSSNAITSLKGLIGLE